MFRVQLPCLKVQLEARADELTTSAAEGGCTEAECKVLLDAVEDLLCNNLGNMEAR